MSGGCGTFATAYLKMVSSCKRNRGRGAEQSVINSYQNPSNKKKAYIDPNDPSIIYLQQPEVAQNINYNPWGYQPVPQSEPMQISPNQINQQQPMPQNNNNQYMMPPNIGNNVNNNYPNFEENNNNQGNQNGEMDLPSEQELYNSKSNNNQQQAYPNQGMGGLNDVINNQQQQQGGGKYFGFWGPNLDRNPNGQ